MRKDEVTVLWAAEGGFDPVQGFALVWAMRMFVTSALLAKQRKEERAVGSDRH